MSSENTKTKTLKLVICALFAALIAVSAQVTLPLPSGVPITLQTFGITLCAAIGGAVSGTVSAAVYLLLGAVGLPVFAGMHGGLATLLGPTGGFLFGFIPFAFLCGIQMKNVWLRIAVSVGGLAVCYLTGAVQFALVSQTDFINSVILTVLPYIVKDVLSIAAAQLIAVPVRKAVLNQR